jgi:hypothetical protein
MAKIRAMLVIEILGRPPEHIREGMKLLLERLATEKGLKIIEKKIHEPAPMEKSKDLFTTFSEVEIECDSLLTLYGICFAYMPSHVEVISPETLSIQAQMVLKKLMILRELRKNHLLKRKDN